VKYFVLRSKRSLDLFGIRKTCLISGKRKAIKLTEIIIMGYHCYQLHTKLYQISFFQRLSPYIVEIIGDDQCGFQYNRSTNDEILRIGQILEKKWEQNEIVHQLFTDFKKACESDRREVLYIFF
jgi:hypothetical protein